MIVVLRSFGSFKKDSRYRVELRNDGICERDVARTIESQTQPDPLYQDLASCAEARKRRATPTAKQARAVFGLKLSRPRPLSQW